MYRADRLLDPASSDRELPCLPVSQDFWTLLARQRSDISVSGRVLRLSLSHLGTLGLDRYELAARVVLPNGWFDQRLWLLTVDELEAIVAAIGDDAEAARITAFVAAVEKR